MKNLAVATLPIIRVQDDGMQDMLDQVAVEEPLEIQMLWHREEVPTRKSISITMRTPGNDEDLAAGFLFTEGILQSAAEIYKMSAVPGDEQKILISLAADAEPHINTLERNFYTTSACGVCGKASIDALKTVSIYKDIPTTIQVTAATLAGLQDQLLAQQEAFEQTGGLHAAALFSATGHFLSLREDVGRHNALDKLIGAAFLKQELPLNDAVLLLSGRASFELVQKATMAGIRIVAAVGAPSSLAIAMAEEAGITLIGFLRKNRFNIYTHPGRVVPH